MSTALPSGLSSRTARFSAPIREPKYPGVRKIGEAGSRGSRLSRLGTRGRDDNREAVQVMPQGKGGRAEPLLVQPAHREFAVADAGGEAFGVTRGGILAVGRDQLG